MNNLENEVKALIIEALNLEDMTPEDIETDAPLFGEGLGLDSIDALELGLAVKKRFGVSLSGETEDHFNISKGSYNAMPNILHVKNQNKVCTVQIKLQWPKILKWNKFQK